MGKGRTYREVAFYRVGAEGKLDSASFTNDGKSRLKDFRRVAIRYDRLARNFFSAVALASPSGCNNDQRVGRIVPISVSSSSQSSAIVAPSARSTPTDATFSRSTQVMSRDSPT